jgi:iron(III) transport system ATP-binding protein
VLAVIGKSGSGKTTLLKCIYGMEDLLSGEILLDDRKVLGPSWNIMPGNPDMKLVTQEFYVLENHTVAENIHDRLVGFKDEEKQKRTKRLLKLLELEPLRDIRARNLSSGQRQRVAIARALAVIPKVLLLDEPFSNLDKLLAEKLYAFIGKEVRRHRTAVILITHLPEEALKHADRIAIMHDGRLLQSGDKWKVYYRPKNTRLAGLLGDFTVIHSSDLEKKSPYRESKRVFVRPDQLRVNNSTVDLVVDVISSEFNGRCFEVLGETKSGGTVMAYSPKHIPPETTQKFRIVSPEHWKATQKEAPVFRSY